MENPHAPASVIKTREHDELPVVPEPTGGQKSLEMTTPGALSNKLSPGTFPEAEDTDALDIEDMDTVPEQLVQRQDTLDSYRSSFARRTNTGWSSAISAVTDYTEPDPDNATVHDELDEHYASASRSYTLPCPADSFQSPPPTRSPSFNVVDGESSMEPSQNTASSDTRPLTHSALRRLRELSSRHGGGPGRHGRGPMNPGPLPIHPKPPKSSLKAPAGEPMEGASLPRRSTLGWDDGLNTDPPSSPGHPASASAEDALHHNHPASRPHSEADLSHKDTEAWTPEGSSGAEDELDDADAAVSQKLDEKLVQDVCDRLLKHVFGADLHDLAGTEAASAAYNSVSYCLDELSHIMSANSVASFVIPISEMGRGGEYSHTPILPAGGSDLSAQGSGGNGSQRSQKRPSNGDEDHDEGGASDGSGGGGGKRPRKEGSVDSSQDGALRLSCPFRKRNPVKFNVRDFQSCAVQSFPDISQLKRHVKIFHKQRLVHGFACPRCKRNMGSKEALDIHLAAPNESICTFQETLASQDPEDGINAKMEDALNGRRANTKVDTWEILWGTLFPMDGTIPDSAFVPPIELDEVYADFRADDFRKKLEARISSGDLDFSRPGHDMGELASKLADICEEQIDIVFETCRQHKIGSLPCPKRRKRGVGKAKVADGSANGPTDQNQPTIPPAHPNQVIFAGASNENSPVSSSLDTPHSGESWPYHAGHTSQLTLAAPNTALTETSGGYLDIQDPHASLTSNIHGGRGLATRTDAHVTDYTSQPGPNHHSRVSEDSAVSFERPPPAFGGNFYQPVPQAFGHQQFPNVGFMRQTNGRVNFMVPGALPVQPSMPGLPVTGAAGSAPMNHQNIFQYGSPVDPTTFGSFTTQSGLGGTMDEGNHVG